jgi:hypothetical protein
LCSQKLAAAATRLWANGQASYSLANSVYNFLTPNGGWGNVSDPPTASLPVKDTDSLTAKAHIIPATGRRNTDGSIAAQGTNEHYWSNIPYNSTNGYLLYFDSSYVYPVTSGNYAVGHPIRCVRI